MLLYNRFWIERPMLSWNAMQSLKRRMSSFVNESSILKRSWKRHKDHWKRYMIAKDWNTKKLTNDWLGSQRARSSTWWYQETWWWSQQAQKGLEGAWEAAEARGEEAGRDQCWAEREHRYLHGRDWGAQETTCTMDWKDQRQKEEYRCAQVWTRAAWREIDIWQEGCWACWKATWTYQRAKEVQGMYNKMIRCIYDSVLMKKHHRKLNLRHCQRKSRHLRKKLRNWRPKAR